jgi:O-methyltransferase
MLTLEHAMQVLLKPEEMVHIELDYPEINDPYFFQVARPISQLTISDIAAQWALYKAIEHVVKHKIPGDIVECGVWNGGSMLLAAFALAHFGDTTRKIYLYDTFEGMPEPVSPMTSIAMAIPRARSPGHIAPPRPWEPLGFWRHARAWSSLVLSQPIIPPDNLVFVPGMVEDTMESTLPDQIALLRLDTDLYASTYHELVHGYPKPDRRRRSDRRRLRLFPRRPQSATDPIHRRTQSAAVPDAAKFQRPPGDQAGSLRCAPGCKAATARYLWRDDRSPPYLRRRTHGREPIGHARARSVQGNC